MIPWAGRPDRVAMLVMGARAADELARHRGYTRACPVFWIELHAIDADVAAREYPKENPDDRSP